jgi:flagellar assembly factor FliW
MPVSAATRVSEGAAPEAADLPVIEFVAPMPGFPEARRFLLVRLDEAGLLFALTSIDSPGLRFLVLPPMPYFPDYAPEVEDDTLAALGVSVVEDLLILLLVTTGDTMDDVTVNLMAPIVLHQDTRKAVQLVLSRSGLPVRAPLKAP